MTLTTAQARQLVLEMAACWPNPAVPEATLHEWAAWWAKLDPEVARLTLDSCRDSCRYWPSFAEAQEAARAARRAVDARKPAGELAAPAADPNVARRYLDEIRTKLPERSPLGASLAAMFRRRR